MKSVTAHYRARRCRDPVGGVPYAYRLVSEVLSSNGSTSRASICGSTLALMAAGVPIGPVSASLHP
ncbi:MAG: hypothetical protein ACLS8R_08110 [Anaeromassilibacillus sp.]